MKTTNEILYNAGQQLTEANSTLRGLYSLVENNDIKTDDMLYTISGAARSIDAVATDVIDHRNDLEAVATTKKPIEINIDIARPSDIKHNTTKLFVLLAALQRITGSRKYYSEIDHLEDLPHNMEILFDELDALHGMIFEEVVDLEERVGVRK